MNKRIWIIAIAALTTTINVMAQESGGYHGPSWTTQSIPGVSTRAISEKDVQAALVTCAIVGDKTRGLKSVLNRVLDVIVRPGTVFGAHYGRFVRSDFSNSRMTFPSETEFLMDPTNNKGNRIEDSTTGSGSELLSTYSISISNHFDDDDGKWKDRFDISIGYATGVDLQYVWGQYLPEMRFPVVTYKNLIAARQYDEFGNDMSDMIVKGLAIQLPPEFQTNGAAVKLINRTTQKPAAFTLNYHEWVACISSELQRIP